YVTQMTAQYLAVYLSKPQPFKYMEIVNPEVYGSDKEAVADAVAANLYAKWVLRRNRDGMESHEFADDLYTYGNVPEQVYWETEEIGKIKFGYARFQKFPLYNLWADVNGGPLEDQPCVITATSTSFATAITTPSR
ncbi:MAG: hypothetical protein O3A47_04185, partial [Chloroflexi bacterium]|nr:hypothetical protein [Chloroflexota bacterium]